MKKYFYSAIMFGLLFASCGEQEGGQVEQTPEKSQIKNCLYSYNSATSQLDWTAYKFLKKAGVGGAFTEIQVSSPESTGDAHSMIEALSFTIPITSTETKDAGRNKKIQEFFFGSLASTDMITGKVVSLGDNGKAILAITMNEITQDVEGEYTLDGATFKYNTEIDVNKWNAQAGISALNEECKDLHTDLKNGDTESKLWSEVSISFSTTLTEVCD